MAQPLTRHQPFKALYIFWLVNTTILFRIPWWCIRFVLRGSRPRPSWSLKRCIMVTVYREVLMGLSYRLGLDGSFPPPQPGDESIDAIYGHTEGLGDHSNAFCGEIRRMATIAGVHPSQVPVYWIFRPGHDLRKLDLRAQQGEKIVLHIHGGAFYLGSAHPHATTSNISHGLLARSQTLKKILAVEYRLSAGAPDRPVNPFPAAILDCIAAYQHLVEDMGFEPKNITVLGDSAGGNLAFALVRHLVENSIPGLSPPGRLISCSAWLDLSYAGPGHGSSRKQNYYSDILSGLGGYPQRTYLGTLSGEEAEKNRYISPSSPHNERIPGLYHGFPRTYISAGGAESILDDSVVVAERLKEDGVDVVFDVEPDAVHDYMLFKWHEPERTKGLRRMASWLEEDVR